MMNKHAIKSAIDDFENDNFVDAKEKLRTQIRNARNRYIEKEIGRDIPLPQETKFGTYEYEDEDNDWDDDIDGYGPGDPKFDNNKLDI